MTETNEDVGQQPPPPRRRSRTPSAPREVELKYLVRDLEALRGWLARDWGGALDGVESGDEQTVEVEDRYVDTAYGALAQAGFGARLRREDGGPISITVKTVSHDRPGDATEAARRTGGTLPARGGRRPSRRTTGPRPVARQRSSGAHQRGARRRSPAHPLHHQPAPREAHAGARRRTGAGDAGPGRGPPRCAPAGLVLRAGDRGRRSAAVPTWPAWPPSSRLPGTSPRSHAPRRRSPAGTSPRPPRTRRIGCRACLPRRASRPMIRSERPGARCCACTLPGC